MKKFLGTLSLLTLAACAHGPLSSQVDYQNANDSAESECDVQWDQAKKEIAQTLDDKSSTIEEYYQNSPPSRRYQRFPLGPITLLERVPDRSPKILTQTTVYSWKELYQRYQKLKNKPVNDDWVDFEEDVKSILFDDTHRRFYPDRHRFTMSDKRFLESVFKKIAECLNAANCSEPGLSGTELKWAEKIPVYQRSWHDFNWSALPKLKRDLLLQLKNQISRDYQLNFGFTRNPSVRRLSQQELLVPLDPGPFEAASGFLGQLLETTWSTPHLKVKVRWQKSTYFDPVYEFILNPDYNSRDWTGSLSNRKVALHQVERESMIAHEFGHVLGFPDHYYTDFDSASCEYQVSVNRDDLMSDGETPTREEFEDLESQYPVAK